MAFPFQRSFTADKEALVMHDGHRTTRWVVPPGRNSVLEIHAIHKPDQFKDVPMEKNLLIPPYHWHWYQNEYFNIKKGRFIFNLEGQKSVKTAADGTIKIPMRARHTFWVDPACEEECILEITANESSGGDGITEKFFRNLYSYIDDCYTHKTPPSLPQLLLFLHSAEVSLAFPGMPGFLSQWLGYGMGLVIGNLIGRYVFGYKDSYPEYFDPKMVKKE